MGNHLQVAPPLRRACFIIPLIFASIGGGLYAGSYMGGPQAPPPHGQVHGIGCVEDEVQLMGACTTIDDLPPGRVRDAAASMRHHCPYPEQDAVLHLDEDEIIGQCVPHDG